MRSSFGNFFESWKSKLQKEALRRGLSDRQLVEKFRKFSSRYPKVKDASESLSKYFSPKAVEKRFISFSRNFKKVDGQGPAYPWRSERDWKGSFMRQLEKVENKLLDGVNKSPFDQTRRSAQKLATAFGGPSRVVKSSSLYRSPPSVFLRRKAEKLHEFLLVHTSTPAAWSLVGLNVSVYLLWKLLGHTCHLDDHFYGPMDRHFTASWHNIRSLRLHGLLLCNVSQSEFLHLAMNVMVIAMFAPVVEAVYGARVLTVAYFVCGLVGSMSEVIRMWFVKGNAFANTKGASASALGLFGLACLTHPFEKVLLWGAFPVQQIRLFVSVMLLEALWAALSPALGDGGVAHTAHVCGGATAVTVLYWLRFCR